MKPTPAIGELKTGGTTASAAEINNFIEENPQQNTAPANRRPTYSAVPVVFRLGH
jgi:hypothetical protein